MTLPSDFVRQVFWGGVVGILNVVEFNFNGNSLEVQVLDEDWAEELFHQVDGMKKEMLDSFREVVFVSTTLADHIKKDGWIYAFDFQVSEEGAHIWRCGRVNMYVAFIKINDDGTKQDENRHAVLETDTTTSLNEVARQLYESTDTAIPPGYLVGDMYQVQNGGRFLDDFRYEQYFIEVPDRDLPISKIRFNDGLRVVIECYLDPYPVK
jgi:hypothetical protein